MGEKDIENTKKVLESDIGVDSNSLVLVENEVIAFGDFFVSVDFTGKSGFERGFFGS